MFLLGCPFWGMGVHEPLIIALFLPIISCRNWKVPWTIRGINWAYEIVRAFELKYKREWEQPVPIQMEGKLCQLLEESCESSGYIMRIFLCWERAIPFVPDCVMRRFLCQTSER